MTDENGADVSQEQELEQPNDLQEPEGKTGREEEQETGTENEADSPPAGKDEADEKPDPVQSRIDKLTKRFRDAEREAQSVRAENEKLRQQLEAKPEQTEPVKTLSDFDYDESKYRDYLFGQAAEVARREAKKAVSETTRESNAERIRREHEARESEFSSTVKDYQDVVYGTEWAASPVMAEELRISDIGPEMAYHLAKHPEVASEISKLSDREAIRRMTLLESSLKSEKAKAGKKVSGAPPPPPKIQGKEAGLSISTTDPASDKLSDEEWFKAEEKRLAKLRG